MKFLIVLAMMFCVARPETDVPSEPDAIGCHWLSESCAPDYPMAGCCQTTWLCAQGYCTSTRCHWSYGWWYSTTCAEQPLGTIPPEPIQELEAEAVATAESEAAIECAAEFGETCRADENIQAEPDWCWHNSCSGHCCNDGPRGECVICACCWYNQHGESQCQESRWICGQRR